MSDFGLTGKAKGLPTIEFLACQANDDDVYVILRGTDQPVCVVLNEKVGKGHEACPTILRPNVKTRLNSVDDKRNRSS
jgi:hypothetical protein